MLRSSWPWEITGKKPHFFSNSPDLHYHDDHREPTQSICEPIVCFLFFFCNKRTGFTVWFIYAVYNTAFKTKGRQCTTSKVTEHNLLFNIASWSIICRLSSVYFMSALDVSLVPRVSLRLGYRSRPIRICNDMSDQLTHQDKLVLRLHIS